MKNRLLNFSFRHASILLLLCFVFLILGFVTLSLSEETKPLILVALGDSTTAGTPGFRSPREKPPSGQGDERSQYAYWMMKRRPEWKVINQGINGQRSDQILNRFDTDVLPYKPDVVIVLAGVNDLYQGYSAERVKKNLEAIYARAREAKIGVLACTILPYNAMNSTVKARMLEVNEWIKNYSDEQGFGFCDTYRVVEDPNRPSNLAGSPDGLHPDIEGYRKMGEAIADILESRLLT
ncbi:MAG TPA: GDSL-type esterase/lipase family protein [bacterium]|nr:GDSL-type esterase/lipase family protein [bacterium]